MRVKISLGSLRRVCTETTAGVVHSPCRIRPCIFGGVLGRGESVFMPLYSPRQSAQNSLKNVGRITLHRSVQTRKRSCFWRLTETIHEIEIYRNRLCSRILSTFLVAHVMEADELALSDVHVNVQFTPQPDRSFKDYTGEVEEIVRAGVTSRLAYGREPGCTSQVQHTMTAGLVAECDQLSNIFQLRCRDFHSGAQRAWTPGRVPSRRTMRTGTWMRTGTCSSPVKTPSVSQTSSTLARTTAFFDFDKL